MESDYVRLAHSPARSNASAQRSLTASGMPGGMKACAYSWTCEATMSSIIRVRDRRHHHISPAWMPKRCRRASPDAVLVGILLRIRAGHRSQPWSRKHRPVHSALVASAVVVQKRRVRSELDGVFVTMV